MDRYYYEYTVDIDAFKDEIESFLMDRFYNGIEESDGKLILRSEKSLDDIMDELRTYVDSLIKLFDTEIHLKITKEKKENIDWIEKYKKSITPVEVGEFYIHPSWYEPKEGKTNIKIDPALAFGSGHHETTRGCLNAIQKYVQPGMELLDVGCGSGILSIAAAKKGAVVDICDTDALALEESQKNFSLNGVEFREGWVGSAANAKKKYDIVIANIVADVLIMIAKDLQETTKEGGILILSGIIEKYRNKVKNRFDFSILEELQEGEWITMILRNDRGTDGK
ncbi:50S ribosomal protein L11 methyltransferase [Nitratiruptor sp. SB155-2]|uniref:Ribosomal protein L11 methyltransferase n=1 Tax=Nitratiruptor sp. (strain SB155-2) TaxID=387092 RepID=PRMA_NITSB|nr:50S ribosomal protein L11 methyltransferase [Nitratiruptor sp. SB155-2]A6Q4V8.1 RecName: Full=Ribosomal protein L11 methyltransferase; Short=L11 Mtase [Nitratiruptor sp. SB155-2]BAF70517.1 ribosomal protein L11 methyltransferase [Nitratiruptor sp. SB155-2]